MLLSIEDCVNGQHCIKEFNLEGGLTDTFYFDNLCGGWDEIGALEFVDLWRHSPIKAKTLYRLQQYNIYGMGI